MSNSAVLRDVKSRTATPSPWTDEAHRTAAVLDFVARVGGLTARPPLLLVSGEDDHARFRADAVELVTVPGLAHPLADEPGMEPAPQRPTVKVVDAVLTDWIGRAGVGVSG